MSVYRLIPRVGILVLASAALLGCQSVPLDYKPDPALLKATPAQLQSRIASACEKTQRARGSVESSVLRKNCGCYAAKSVKGMDATEATFFRANGYFSDAYRPKAMEHLNACGFKN